jgi:hypothetical protein
MPDHAVALLVPLALPVAIWLFRRAAALAARADLGSARRFVHAYEDSPPLTRVAAFLLVLAGAIHLALVPGHLAEVPKLAGLFALNGAAFLGIGLAAFVTERWRPWAATLLAATLAAYLFSLGTGREEADLVGTATYLVELIALGVIWVAPEPGLPREGRDPAMAVGARDERSGERRDELTGVGRP